MDPSITGQHGFVTVTKLSGDGAVLIITSETNGNAGKPTPRASLEAWRTWSPKPGFKHDDVTGGGLGGTPEWMCHTKAFYTNSSSGGGEWADSGKPWLTPTSATLAPGETAEYALAFSVATNIREKDITLSKSSTSVVHGTFYNKSIGAPIDSILLVLAFCMCACVCLYISMYLCMHLSLSLCVCVCVCV